MSHKPEIPVLLLTGYLGSGKTTLLNHILNNEKGYRFAVIVNDLGSVNIDAELIQKGGVVGALADGKPASDLVALQNGCICCSLSTDLVKQLADLASSGLFDYILIEASGICDPAPIAQTITMMPRMDPAYTEVAVPRLDSIVTVVDALRMLDEFDGGHALEAVARYSDDQKEGNLTALVVDQIEFCNVIILNKISELKPEEAARLRAIVAAIQPRARIIEADYCNVDIDALLGTGAFDFESVATSAAWVQGIEGPLEEEEEEHHHHDHHEHKHEHDDHDHHGHDHHHHEHDGHDHAGEYGIDTFVYFNRKPFDLNKFDYFIGEKWPKSVIRSKGVVYFSENRDMSYLFEQAGSQKSIREAGYWCATATADELAEMMRRDPNLRRDWDDVYGDRMCKLVVIGQHINRKEITDLLDNCLAD